MPDREPSDVRISERQPVEDEAAASEAIEEPAAPAEESNPTEAIQPNIGDTASLPRPPLVGRTPPPPLAPRAPSEDRDVRRTFPRNLEATEPVRPVRLRASWEARTGAEETPEPRAASARRTVPVNGYFVVFAAVGTLIILAFLIIEPTPRWLLLVGAVITIFGMDGVLRATWREPFASEGETTPYLFLPALYMLGAPIVVEHNIPGGWLIPAGLLVSAGFAGIVLAEIVSVRTGAPEYAAARFVITAGAYFTLFALASMTYVFGAELSMALISVALLSLMLGIEVLREGEIDRTETIILAIVSAAIVMQARWLLHYLPLDGYLAGLGLTLVFFVTTGLLHAYVQHAFNRSVAIEYAIIGAAGALLIVVARASGLA